MIIQFAVTNNKKCFSVRAKVGVNNFRAEGLRWYVVDHVTFNALRLNLGAQVTLPWLTVTGKYLAYLFT